MGLRTRPFRTDFRRGGISAMFPWRKLLVSPGLWKDRHLPILAQAASCGPWAARRLSGTERPEKEADGGIVTSSVYSRNLPKGRVLGGSKVTCVSSGPRGRREGVVRDEAGVPGPDPPQMAGKRLPRLPGAGQRSVPGASASGHRGRVTRTVSEGITGGGLCSGPGLAGPSLRVSSGHITEESLHTHTRKETKEAIQVFVTMSSTVFPRSLST